MGDKKSFKYFTDKTVNTKFVDKVFESFTKEGVILEKKYELYIGVSAKRIHTFDLGNDSTLVICKSNKWTKSQGIPYATIKKWHEVMFCFNISPKQYIKYFFVLMDFNQKRCQTMTEYYIEKYQHFIPKELLIYEYYAERKQFEIYIYDEIMGRHMLQQQHKK